MSEPFLSSGEEWLFREVELLHRLHAEIRDTHLKYQNWFMLTQGVLLAAVMNTLIEKRFAERGPLLGLVCSVGLALGSFAWILQLRHIADGAGRMRRIRQLSLALCRSVVTSDGRTTEFMAYIAGDVPHHRYSVVFSYSRIRLVVDAIFPILWISLFLLIAGSPA